MPFQPCPGIVAVSLGFSQADGEFAENTFHADNGTGDAWTESQLTAVANAFFQWWLSGDSTNQYTNFQAGAASLVSLEAVDLTAVDALTGVATLGSLPESCGGPSDVLQLANGLTVAITARTALRGRSYRGRTFPVALRADNVTDEDKNVVKSDVAANLVSAFNGMLPGGANDIAAYAGVPAGMAVCILSRYNQDDVPAAPHKRAAGIGTPVVSYGMHDQFVDYQRRRAPGHNRHH